MAKRGRPRKNTQNLETFRTPQRERRLFKRTLRSSEGDDSEYSWPSTSKRKLRSSANAMGANSFTDIKSEVYRNSSAKQSITVEGESNRKTLEIENKADSCSPWKPTRYLRSMGKVSDFIQLPYQRKINTTIKKGSDSNKTPSQKYDKNGPEDTTAYAKLWRDISMTKLPDSNGIAPATTGDAALQDISNATSVTCQLIEQNRLHPFENLPERDVLDSSPAAAFDQGSACPDRHKWFELEDQIFLPDMGYPKGLDDSSSEGKKSKKMPMDNNFMDSSVFLNPTQDKETFQSFSNYFEDTGTSVLQNMSCLESSPTDKGEFVGNSAAESCQETLAMDTPTVQLANTKSKTSATLVNDFNFDQVYSRTRTDNPCTPSGDGYTDMKMNDISPCADINDSNLRLLRSRSNKLNAASEDPTLQMENMQKDVSVSKNQTLWNSTKIKLKIKKENNITLKNVPTTVKMLLTTGLLEGHAVKYVDRGEKVKLTGVIQGGGILCDCDLCQGRNVVSICYFEEHAGSTARHASDFIVLENGMSLREVLEEGRGVSAESYADVICNALKGSRNKASSMNYKSKAYMNNSKQRKYRSHYQTPDKTTRIPKKSIRHNTKYSFSLPETKSLEHSSAQSKFLSKDMRLHKIPFMANGLPDGTELAYYVKGQRLLDGYKQGPGICCSCCNTVISCSQFEAHAGRASRRNPYNSIFLSNGQSLHEVALSMTRINSAKAFDGNEDICRVCGDGGDLVLCDGCPRVFHKECVGLSGVPDGDWFCSYCEHSSKVKKGSCKDSRTSQQKFGNRCTRVVKAPEKAAGGCVLCRREDFDSSGFGERTVMLCDQCEKEFHVGCLREHGMADLKELPEGEWFCSDHCTHIHSCLQKLVAHGPNKLPSLINEELTRKRNEKGFKEDDIANIAFQLLHGSTMDYNSRVLLSQVKAIFTECFDPITDVATGQDLIPSMVFSRSIRDQEFRGMYCAVLTVESTVVSAGIFRIFGRKVAELPLVATSPKFQGQGYFQALFSCMEKLLTLLEVENLALPAAEEAESFWINKFGFTIMSRDQFEEYRRDLQIMSFQGNTMLEKTRSRFMCRQEVSDWCIDVQKF